MNHNYRLLALLFPIIICAQCYVTFTSRNLYPLSPYRMFSKNWYDGIQMDQIHFRNHSGIYRPWDLLKIPFFQANNTSFATFLDSPLAAQRATYCSLLTRRVDAPLEVVSDVVEYKRATDKIITPIVVKSEVVHVCK